MTTEIPKSEFPYLVDIKITTKCNHNCWWCYADACFVEKGKDADAYFTCNVLGKTLKEARVFEVVLGGGEPTLFYDKHDGFAKLSYVVGGYRENGFKVSMTTRNYEWYKLDDFQAAVQSLHAIAISCETIADLKKAVKLREQIYNVPWVRGNGDFVKITIQKILQLHPLQQLKGFLKACQDLGFYNVTLLGFKPYGRAVDGQFYPYDNKWIDVAAKSELSIGVDSALVQAYGPALKEAGVPGWMVQGVEGRQTCYIDAVTQTIYPSSTSMIGVAYKPKYGNETEEFLKIFGSF